MAQEPLGFSKDHKPYLSSRSPSRTFSSLWPTYMLMSSGPFTLNQRMSKGETSHTQFDLSGIPFCS